MKIIIKLKKLKRDEKLKLLQLNKFEIILIMIKVIVFVIYKVTKK